MIDSCENTAFFSYCILSLSIPKLWITNWDFFPEINDVTWKSDDVNFLFMVDLEPLYNRANFYTQLTFLAILWNEIPTCAQKPNIDMIKFTYFLKLKC